VFHVKKTVQDFEFFHLLYCTLKITLLKVLKKRHNSCCQTQRIFFSFVNICYIFRSYWPPWLKNSK